MISENDSAFSHGRIPAHEFKGAMNVLLVLLQAKANISRHKTMRPNIGFEAEVYFNTQPIASRHITGFWTEQVAENTRKLIVIPPIIKCRSTGFLAPRY
jgi:hypothetical protein